MKQVLKLILISLILFPLALGCQKQEPEEIPLETDPAKIIIGKWRQTKRNNINVGFSNNYTEYLIDSINQAYFAESGNFMYWKYWVDSILTKEFYHTSGNIIRMKFDYTFSNKNNQLKLDI